MTTARARTTVRRPVVGFIFLQALFAATLLIATPARAEQQKWAAAYVEWTFDRETPGIALAQDLWIPQAATASFFTLNWTFVDSDGGYIGLQSDEAGAGNARFSIWNATAARGESCRRFDGEGEGMTCETPVTIAPDKTYRVHVTRGEAEAGGQWWIGWLEERGGARRQIGALRTKAGATRIASEGVHDFSEFWGDAVRACRDVPLSAAAFGPPTLAFAEGGAMTGGRARGTRPDGHHCNSGGERSGAVAGHRKTRIAGASGMLITLGGDARNNRALASRLATRPPAR